MSTATASWNGTVIAETDQAISLGGRSLLSRRFGEVGVSEIIANHRLPLEGHRQLLRRGGRWSGQRRRRLVLRRAKTSR